MSVSLNCDLADISVVIRQLERLGLNYIGYVQPLICVSHMVTPSESSGEII